MNANNLTELIKNAEAAGACRISIECIEQYESLKELIENEPEHIAAYAFWYTSNVRKGPWKFGEPFMARNSDIAYFYANQILKAPFKLGEVAIATRSTYSYYYASRVLKGRFKLGEKVIFKDKYYKKLYIKSLPFKYFYLWIF